MPQFPMPMPHCPNAPMLQCSHTPILLYSHTSILPYSQSQSSPQPQPHSSNSHILRTTYLHILFYNDFYSFFIVYIFFAPRCYSVAIVVPVIFILTLANHSPASAFFILSLLSRPADNRTTHSIFSLLMTQKHAPTNLSLLLFLFIFRDSHTNQNNVKQRCGTSP
ncbi:hypothetical protein CLIB1423_15S02982 [[Candida] railenensis]|uniref:Uncharacterized protein n=1 Tax=[Candida] railenensis TaxID=45579 RepID=A0A9P0QRQ8_9ASCO|nr:hypothetical protein CLIB1423_15S02982 [[Candida] railenensis]